MSAVCSSISWLRPTIMVVLVASAVFIFVTFTRWTSEAINVIISSKVLQYPSSLFSPPWQASPEAPRACLSTSPTLEQLLTCFDDYLVPPEYYDSPRYNEAQPTSDQRASWTEAVASLLATDNNCSSIAVPAPLTDLYNITTFTESSSSSSNSYCVLFEITSENGVYTKGWGVMVVPASRHSISRLLHISAPHPSADTNTTQQAAALFKSTGARSLFVPGRFRMAFLEATDCVQSSASTVYYKTDPAHDNLQPFYDANKAIWAWQNENGGCPSSSCAFIQFHGKSPKTCPYDQMFLSSGLGRSSLSIAWYTDNVGLPIRRLQSQLKLAFPTWNVSLPSDSSCSLIATKNIMGRFLNGIEDSEVCSRGSNAKLATGVFVHIEQSAASRAESAYEAWSGALMEAFEAV